VQLDAAAPLVRRLDAAGETQACASAAAVFCLPPLLVLLSLFVLALLLVLVLLFWALWLAHGRDSVSVLLLVLLCVLCCCAAVRGLLLL